VLRHLETSRAKSIDGVTLLALSLRGPAGEFAPVVVDVAVPATGEFQSGLRAAGEMALAARHFRVEPEEREAGAIVIEGSGVRDVPTGLVVA
jgi:hypothetical protein